MKQLFDVHHPEKGPVKVYEIETDPNHWSDEPAKREARQRAVAEGLLTQDEYEQSYAFAWPNAENAWRA